MPFIIHRKPPYHIYVEEDSGGAMAHVAELPGCFAVGRDASQAVRAASGAIVAFLAWLRAHREPLVPEAYVSRPSMADLFVAEIRREGAPLVGGSRTALFAFDKAVWDDAKVERALRWLSYSRTDLFEKIEGLGGDALRQRQLAPDRTLWDALWHIANAEYGYINRISGPLDDLEPITDSEPADVIERLAAIRAMFERQVRAIPAEQRGDVVLPIWADRPDEPWTLPKVLRCALEHEREHLLQI